MMDESRKEKIAAALGFSEFPAAMIDEVLQDRIRQRVRELWCINDNQYVEYHYGSQERHAIYLTRSGENAYDISKPRWYNEDTEAKVWEEALLWLAERGSDAKD